MNKAQRKYFLGLLIAVLLWQSCDKMEPLPEPVQLKLNIECYREKNGAAISDFRFILQKRTESPELWQAIDTLTTDSKGLISYETEDREEVLMISTNSHLNPEYLVPFDKTELNISPGDSVRIAFTKKKVFKLHVYNVKADSALDNCSGFMYIRDIKWGFIPTDIKWHFDGPVEDTSFTYLLQPEQKYFINWNVYTHIGGYRDYTQEVIPNEADSVFVTIAY